MSDPATIVDMVDAHYAERVRRDAERLARRYHADVDRLDRSRSELAEAVRLTIKHTGMTEQAAADLAGVSRLTVRKWLGKDKR